MKKITLCGDDCLKCPRYLAKTKDELRKVAELWYKIGWRDKIVSADEIKCSGCSEHKNCTYNLVSCVKVNKVEKCKQCECFPCEKINKMLMLSKQYQKKCKEICSSEEYAALEQSFFHKENNLMK